MQLVYGVDIHYVFIHISSGSRINKEWFLVHDSQQEMDAVLTMVPWSTQCVIAFTKSTKKTLKELFSLLQVC